MIELEINRGKVSFLYRDALTFFLVVPCTPVREPAHGSSTIFLLPERALHKLGASYNTALNEFHLQL